MTEIDQKYRTLLILWFILLFTQLLFVVVIYSAFGSRFGAEAEQIDVAAPTAIIGGAVFLALSNFVISFIIRKKAIERGIAERKTSYVQTALVIGCAFCEAISIIGLVLLLGFGYKYFYLWLILGFIGIFLHFPRREHLYAAAGISPDGV